MVSVDLEPAVIQTARNLCFHDIHGNISAAMYRPGGSQYWSCNSTACLVPTLRLVLGLLACVTLY